MSLRDIAREFKEVLLSEIDPPTLDARIERDPDKLQELAADIARRGVILPIALVRVGARYEVVDGFRRFLASRMADLVRVPAMVYPTKEAALEGVKYAANAYREEMSPAEEAVFFHELFEHECEHDIERVAAMVGKRVAYVSARLELLGGAEDVFEAVRGRKIQLGVAAELNKVSDPQYRNYYLQSAIRGGATVSMVAGWVQDWKRDFVDNQSPAPPTPAPAAAVPSGSYDPHRCYLCDQNDPRFIPEQVSIHTHCRLAILDPLLAQSRGGSST